MAVMNPCCCCRLQLGTTIVAIINIIGSVLMLIGSILQLIFFLVAISVAAASTTSKKNENEYEDDSTRVTVSLDGSTKAGTLAAVGIVVLLVAIFYIVQAIVFLVASIFLFIGARKRNIYKCRIWFVLALLFLFFSFIQACSSLFYGKPTSHGDKEAASAGGIIIGFLIVFVIVGYQAWVVYAFMEEVKEDGRVPTGAAVQYVPKDGTVENPPPYGQGGYAPYGPATAAYPPQVGFAQPAYPPLPSDDSAPLPYKSTTTNY